MNRRIFLRSALVLAAPPVLGQIMPSHRRAVARLPISSACAKGQDWSTRVVANGGAAPSAATVDAVCTFYSALVAASIDSKMLAFVTLCPDNLTAARTPIFGGAQVGSDPWVNGGFLAGDLSSAGLLGVGKYLSTGIIPATAYANNNSAGLSLYNMTSSNGNVMDFAVQDGAPGNRMGLIIGYSGTAYCDCWNLTGGRLTASNSNFTGFMSMSRESATSASIYTGNSGGFNRIANNNAQSGIGTRTTTYPLFLYALNNTGTAQFHSNRRFSFGAVHLGLTQTETQALYNAVQAMRTSFGGGYV